MYNYIQNTAQHTHTTHTEECAGPLTERIQGEQRNTLGRRPDPTTAWQSYQERASDVVRRLTSCGSF